MPIKSAKLLPTTIILLGLVYLSRLDLQRRVWFLNKAREHDWAALLGFDLFL